MNNKLSVPIKAQLELQTYWLINSLKDITEEEANKQIAGNLNSIKWIAGHVLNTRYIMIGMLTVTEPNKGLTNMFGKGTKGMVDSSFPTITELIKLWYETEIDLIKAINTATDDFLLSNTPIQTSIPDKTVLGFIAYMTIHESFHIGQLSELRKLLNKETMSMKIV